LVKTPSSSSRSSSAFVLLLPQLTATLARSSCSVRGLHRTPRACDRAVRPLAFVPHARLVHPRCTSSSRSSLPSLALLQRCSPSSAHLEHAQPSPSSPRDDARPTDTSLHPLDPRPFFPSRASPSHRTASTRTAVIELLDSSSDDDDDESAEAGCEAWWGTSAGRRSEHGASAEPASSLEGEGSKRVRRMTVARACAPWCVLPARSKPDDGARRRRAEC